MTVKLNQSAINVLKYLRRERARCTTAACIAVVVVVVRSSCRKEKLVAHYCSCNEQLMMQTDALCTTTDQLQYVFLKTNTI